MPPNTTPASVSEFAHWVGNDWTTQQADPPTCVANSISSLPTEENLKHHKPTRPVQSEKVEHWFSRWAQNWQTDITPVPWDWTSWPPCLRTNWGMGSHPAGWVREPSSLLRQLVGNDIRWSKAA
jgi:hypothetical protein